MYMGKISGFASNIFNDNEIGIILFEDFDSINCNINDVQTQRVDSIFSKVLAYLITQPEENKQHQNCILHLNYESRGIKKSQTLELSEIACSNMGLRGKILIPFSSKKQNVIILSLVQVNEFLCALRSPAINEILAQSDHRFSLDKIMSALEDEFADEPEAVRAQMIDLLRRIKKPSLPLKYQQSLIRQKSSRQKNIADDQQTNQAISTVDESAQSSSIDLTANMGSAADTQIEIESEDIVFLMSNVKTEKMLDALEEVVNNYNAQGRSHSLFKKHPERDVQIKRLNDFIVAARQDIDNSNFDKVKYQILKVVFSALSRTEQTHTSHGIGYLETKSRLANYLADYKAQIIHNYDANEIRDAEAFAIAYNHYIYTINSIDAYFNKQKKTYSSYFTFINSQRYEAVASETQNACVVSLEASTQQSL